MSPTASSASAASRTLRGTSPTSKRPSAPGSAPMDEEETAAEDDDDDDQDVGRAEIATPQHCYYCFEVLADRLGTGSSRDGFIREMTAAWKGVRLYVRSNTQHRRELTRRPSPLFVTWNTRKSGHSSSHLRGCIGNFSALDLASGLSEYALVSALKDRRFAPVSARELPSLSCSVSLLHSFESCADYTDWTLGKHGIHIFFLDPKTNPPPVDSGRTSQTATPAEEGSSGGVEGVGGRSLKSRLMGVAAAGKPGRGKQLSATYLPDVATDQGWTKVETIDSAIRKAGYEGKITEAIRRTLRVERYQSAKCTASYANWQTWRDARLPN